MFTIEVPGAPRPVCVEELHLQGTYLGLIEGRPTLSLNKRFLARLREQAERWRSHAPLKVFAPRPVEGRWLPGICCLALLSDGERRLKLGWLQETAEGLPLPPPGVLAELDWSRDAAEFEI